MSNTASLPHSGPQSDRRDDGLLSVDVLRTFADARGVDPEELDVQLYEHIDLEALNRLHRHYDDVDGAFWSIEFTIDGCEFVVRADGTVSVQ